METNKNFWDKIALLFTNENKKEIDEALREKILSNQKNIDAFYKALHEKRASKDKPSTIKIDGKEYEVKVQ